MRELELFGYKGYVVETAEGPVWFALDGKLFLKLTEPEEVLTEDGSLKRIDLGTVDIIIGENKITTSDEWLYNELTREKNPLDDLPPLEEPEKEEEKPPEQPKKRGRPRKDPLNLG